MASHYTFAQISLDSAGNITSIPPVDSIWSKANELYTKGQFVEANELYLGIYNSGKQSAALLYNIANTHYKLGNLGQSILFYERALKLEPKDEDIQYNLALAQSQTVDKIEEVPTIFIVSWWNNFRNFLSINQWGIVSLCCFILVLILLLVAFFGKSTGRRKLAFFLGVVFFIGSVGSLMIAQIGLRKLRESKEAIISPAVVSVKAAPDNNSIDLFILHEGTKVNVLETIGGWRRVKTADGNQGWLPGSAAEII
jgi:hypothetical protein